MQSSENIAILDNSSVGKIVAGLFVIDDVMSALAQFLSEDACREWVLKRLHPSGPFCPGCGKEVPDQSLNRFYGAERLKCSRCGKFFTALTGTFLSGCQLNFHEVIVLAILLSPTVTDKKIAEILDMSPANVRIWRNKFEAMGKLVNG